MQELTPNEQGTDTDIRLLKAALKRDRNLKLIIGIALLSICISTLFNIPQRFSPKTVFILSFFCMIIGFCGFYFLLNSILRYDTQKNYVLKTITQHPKKVVWVYYHKTENFPFGIKVLQITILYIRLLNREKIAIQMPEKLILQLLPLLQKRLPNASFGYSKQKAQMYDIAPDLLSK